MTTPTGQSYTAKLDGTEAPYKGDPGTTSVSVKMSGKDTLEETDKRGDKVLSVAKITLNPDGKTAKIMVDDKLHGTTSQFGAVKPVGSLFVFRVKSGEGKNEKPQKNQVVSAGLVLAALLTICAPTLSAQNVTGTILGTVPDPKGAVLPNVTVTITNADQKVVLRTVST